MASAERDPMAIAEDRIEEARRTGAMELTFSALASAPGGEVEIDLVALEVEEFQLTALPEAIGRLTSLQELHLGCNQLTHYRHFGSRGSASGRGEKW